MSRLPRLAVGTVQSDADPLPMLWALMDVLPQRGVHPQNFLSRGCFVPLHGSSPGGAGSVRYLDSWLMSEDICRELFAHGARSCDLALVEGRYSTMTNGVHPDESTLSGDSGSGNSGSGNSGSGNSGSGNSGSGDSGGNLDTLCQWLDLPRVVVLDVARLDACSLPRAPVGASALLLDRVPSARAFARLQTRLESLWNVPVCGALPECRELRATMRRMAKGEHPPRAVQQELGRALCEHLRLDRLMEVAEREFDPPQSNRLRAGAYLDEIHVAIAFDEIFNCYFPDTLDLLELQGATLSTFSPLRNDRLPEGTDVVYLGCGHPERAPEQLAANRCLVSALAKHVYAGGRVYAEGGGLAYLCEELIDEHGRHWPMAGVLPAAARYVAAPPPPRPVEVTLAHGNWLGEGWSQLRGYLNGRWNVEPRGVLRCYAAQEGHELDLIGVQQTIASRIHLNFAAQPEFLQAFFVPHPSAVGAELVNGG